MERLSTTSKLQAMRVPCAAVPGVGVMKKSVLVRLTASGSMEKEGCGRPADVERRGLEFPADLRYCHDEPNQSKPLKSKSGPAGVLRGC